VSVAASSVDSLWYKSDRIWIRHRESWDFQEPSPHMEILIPDKDEKEMALAYSVR